MLRAGKGNKTADGVAWGEVSKLYTTLSKAQHREGQRPMGLEMDNELAILRNGFL